MAEPTKEQTEEARALIHDVLENHPGNPWPAVEVAVAEALAVRDEQIRALEQERSSWQEEAIQQAAQAADERSSLILRAETAERALAAIVADLRERAESDTKEAKAWPRKGRMAHHFEDMAAALTDAADSYTNGPSDVALDTLLTKARQEGRDEVRVLHLRQATDVIEGFTALHAEAIAEARQEGREQAFTETRRLIEIARNEGREEGRQEVLSAKGGSDV